MIDGENKYSITLKTGDGKMVLMETVSSESSSGQISRIVRTDFYLDLEDVNPISFPEEFGEHFSLSAVWLKGVDQLPLKADDNLPLTTFFEPLIKDAGDSRLMIETLLLFPALTGSAQFHESIIKLLGDRVASQSIPRTAPIITMLLAERVVIENSPPVAETISHFLQHATSTSLGILIGTGLTHNPLVMVITIPAGIILMGATLGITKGLERGLAKLVEARITKNPRPRPRKTPKDE
jgi:hypothetical protein